MFKKLNFVTKQLKSNTHTWIQPQGYDTGIKVYNCVTKSKVPLIVKEKSLIKWYTCGPTVYDSSHIGHACCYTKFDIIQNILKKVFNLNVITVMNITDIDDKIIKRSNETGKTSSEVAKHYEKEFWVDLNSLNIPKPDIILRVTDNIELVVDFIDQLIKNNQAYIAGDNSVYFDVSKCGTYGKLQNIGEDPEQMKGSKLKRNPADFALWKSSKAGEPFWESPWGPGRPGWHIECSALASHVFGSEIDIHVGGIDLRFPHHENEEAQSCAYHNNKQWVNYWLHTGHLHLKDSEKMSKSLKNTISIQDLLKATNSNTFRLFCAMSHYRSKIEYSEDFIKTANNLFTVYKNFITNCDEYKTGVIKATVNNDVLKTLLAESHQKINDAFCNDFDTPAVLNVLNNIVSNVNSMLHSSASSQINDLTYVTALSKFVSNTLNVFKVKLKDDSRESGDDSFIDVMNVLNEFRQNVRVLGISEKNQSILKLCDGVRDDLKNAGIDVKDHGKVSSWSR